MSLDRSSNASHSSDGGGSGGSGQTRDRARRTQWNLSAEQEEACVFREDGDATMYANNEAFQNAKENFVKLIGEVEPYEDREWVASERPKTALTGPESGPRPPT